MNGRSSGFWVLIILGLAGVSGAGVLETKQAAPAGSKETTTSTAPVESTDVAACKEKDPLQAMLRDYYTTIPSRLSDANIASVLIATVPDPSDARAAYRFDERLESLERAIQDAGYVVDRHCLPWSSTSGADSKRPSSNIKRPQDAEPGIVLFRDTRNQTNPCLLVLFLVGETPTFGAHKNALIEALDAAREIQPNRRDFQVIGPNFSGSAQSLRIAAEMWAKKWALAEAPEIELSFVTGSATVPGIRKTLSDDIPAAGLAHLKINFYSTVWDDKTAAVGACQPDPDVTLEPFSESAGRFV